MCVPTISKEKPMVRLLSTASALAVLSASVALANPTATSGVGSSSLNGPNEASTTIIGESAIAEVTNGAPPGFFRRLADARVGNSVVASTTGDEVTFGNFATQTVATNTPANTNAQFQYGMNNNAINLQSGAFQQSATLQIGDDNAALISQTFIGNEGAIAQVGDGNNGAIVQDGEDNGAALASLGDDNTSFGLQAGGDSDTYPGGNFLAHGQFGNDNSAVTFQDGEANTAASLQLGNDNASFISQGGGTSVSLGALNGSVFGGAIPAGIIVSGSAIGGLGATANAAASLQIGNGHASAILQTGSGNQAVNYQTTP
jgi:hypothetical protein